VDEVIPDAPYTTQVEFIAKYGIHFVAHGDDVTTDANGLDSYRLVKEAGLYRQFPRTPGVSTTDALARILNPSESSTSTSNSEPGGLAINISVLNAFLSSASSGTPPPLKVLNSSATESFGVHEPTRCSYGHTLALVRQLERPTVYLHGTFDLFSSRDLLQLRNACQDGKLDLLVGIWGEDVSRVFFFSP
jgi:ethanolamine-phosphate cytidylyltransferase